MAFCGRGLTKCSQLLHRYMKVNMQIIQQQLNASGRRELGKYGQLLTNNGRGVIQLLTMVKKGKGVFKKLLKLAGICFYSLDCKCHIKGAVLNIICEICPAKCKMKMQMQMQNANANAKCKMRLKAGSVMQG